MRTDSICDPARKEFFTEVAESEQGVSYDFIGLIT